MHTLWNKLWCVLLSLAILINLLPASALAAETAAEQPTVHHWVEDPPEEVSEIATQKLLSEVSGENQAVIVCEDITLRDEFVKHFQMSD